MCATRPDLAARPEPSDLIRGLGLWSATAIVIGDTIGTGIFLVTSDMARAVGSAKLVFAAWIVGGLIVLFGAFCYAELGAAFPKAGGPYVYLNRGLSPLWGFLFGWMSSFLSGLWRWLRWRLWRRPKTGAQMEKGVEDVQPR